LNSWTTKLAVHEVLQCGEAHLLDLVVEDLGSGVNFADLTLAGADEFADLEIVITSSFTGAATPSTTSACRAARENPAASTQKMNGKGRISSAGHLLQEGKNLAQPRIRAGCRQAGETARPPGCNFRPG